MAQGHLDESRLTEKEKKTINKKHILYWWRVLFIIGVPFYGIYRGWRGINIENDILEIKQQQLQEKKNSGKTLTDTEKNILKKEKLSNWWKLLDVILYPYTLFRAIKSIILENERIDLRKDIIKIKTYTNSTQQQSKHTETTMAKDVNKNNTLEKGTSIINNSSTINLDSKQEKTKLNINH